MGYELPSTPSVCLRSLEYLKIEDGKCSRFDFWKKSVRFFSRHPTKISVGVIARRESEHNRPHYHGLKRKN